MSAPPRRPVPINLALAAVLAAVAAGRLGVGGYTVRAALAQPPASHSAAED